MRTRTACLLTAVGLAGCTFDLDLTFVDYSSCGGSAGENAIDAGGPSLGPPNAQDAATAPDAADLDAGDGCPTCAGALLGEHVLGPFCPASVGHVAWSSYVSCGCVDANACAPVCAGGGWCNSVYPVEGVWFDPSPSCAACLTTPGPSGCGDQYTTCAKH